ncbi:MAG: hypothetical protein IJY66_00095 [Clostridia bacterium]|nr:hypothetical protein [Clostridia bacterium]
MDDVMGPKACGIATVLIDRNEKYTAEALPKEKAPDFRVSTLEELLQI